MKIIVITPVKNEAWILPLFLKTTLRFADHIIIADQGSTDDSKKIIESYERVTVIDNTNLNYREDLRQQLLLDTARKLFAGPNIIFALDADEIISADSYDSDDWQTIRSAAPNTVFYFEKPELYGDPGHTIRYRHNLYPLAFVDDGNIEHLTKKIHSIRVPTSASTSRVDIHGITFLHASYLRPKVQRAKYRFYSVKENDLGTSPWYRRRRRYKNPNHMLSWEPVETSPAEWFDYPASLHIDFNTLQDTADSWYDHDVMQALSKNGGTKYWLDDIWDKDWNKLLSDSGRKKITQQPAFLNWLLKKMDVLLERR